MSRRPDKHPPEAPPDEVALSGRREEFRRALREEIEAATRASFSSAIQLVSGRRISQIGAGFQYLFQVESALQLPDDSPGDLFVGQRRYDTTVVSVSGLAITLSVGEDLGQFVQGARLQSSFTHLMRKLIERIETLREGPNEAGDRLLDGPIGGGPAAVLADGLNAEQQDALASALGRDLTFILGPPGTGKTHTIGAIGARLFDEGRSLLLVSHTNTALDQALVKIGDALEHQARGVLAEGKVFRLGSPRDKQLVERPELLVGTHRARRSQELEEERRDREREREGLVASVSRLSREIEVREWVDAYGPDVTRLRDELSRVAALKIAEHNARREADRRTAGRPAWATALSAARDERIQRARLDELEARDTEAQARFAFYENANRVAAEVLRRLDAAIKNGGLAGWTPSWPPAADGTTTRVPALAAALLTVAGDLDQTREDLAGAERSLPMSESLEPARVLLEELPTEDDQALALDATREIERVAEAAVDHTSTELARAQELLATAEGTGGLLRRVRGLPDPEVQRGVVTTGGASLEEAAGTRDAARDAREEAERMLTRIREALARVHGHEGVPRLGPLREHIATLTASAERTRAQAEADLAETRDTALSEVRQAQAAATEASCERGVAEQLLDAFTTRYLVSPEAISAQAARALDQIATAQAVAMQASADRAAVDDPMRRELSQTLAVLREWGLAEPGPDGDSRRLFEAVSTAHQKASRATVHLDLGAARQAISDANRRIIAIDADFERIDRALADVEATLIAEASIVATTLTSAYLRDEVQGRSFDTVLLDEASMAPIPALWIAASRAEKSVVAVGDNRQLPPICLSEAETAQLWLGRDVFDASEAFSEDEAPNGSGAVVQLREQRRMHPKISAIPNGLIYNGRLIDHPCVSDDGRLNDFYASPWLPDSAVTLVDTGSLDAWVTSVARGGRSSRLNFLSATVCVDLAEAMLRPARPALEPAASPRILIATPYRPHARLVSLMLRENGIDDEVRAGTAHSFQGSEADVVIVDLVNDEPHWKVGMFMQIADPTMSRLFNVALTRAKRRLVIVGDIDYVAKQGAKAFAGRLLRSLLDAGTPRLEAREVVPAGLAARAAAASLLARGGAPEDPTDRLLVTQSDFYRYFIPDLEQATERVVVYSPFITRNRLAELETHIKAVTERGVPMWVVTVPLAGRPKGDRPAYRQLEETLRSWGVRVVHKAKMHEKIVLVDKRLLWSGSLNPLSFRDTQEVMERRTSPEVIAEFIQVLRINDLVGTFVSGDGVCPCCGAELEATEGKNEPFYWRCSRDPDCYRRSAGDDPPRDGRLVCQRCGSPYALAERSEKAIWRCEKDGRHWRPLRKGDLRLPRMREGIPARTLRLLLQEMGIEDGDAGRGQQSLL